MNAGDLGSCLAVRACAHNPIHVTAQGKKAWAELRMRPACTQALRGPSKLCEACVGSRDLYAQIWALTRHHGHMG